MSLLPLSNPTLTDDLLYKKYLGLGDSKPNKPYVREVAGSARPNVLFSQVWQADIPASAPLPPTRDMTNWTVDPTNSKRWTYTNPSYLDSEGKPILAYYEKAPLSSKNLTVDQTYWSLEAATANIPDYNILRRAVPFNYDAMGLNGGYVPFIYNLSSATPDIVIATNDEDHPWNFDPDSGILTFWNANAADSEIVMSFWRYEGPIGPGTSRGTGATSTADGWSKYYLADPPPAIKPLDPVIKSTQIFLPWTNFVQTNVGFTPNYLPATTGFNAYYDTASASLLNKVNTGVFDTITNIGTPLISALVLSKKPVSLNIQTLNPGTGPIGAYVIQQTDLEANNNTMHIWFNNFNKGSNAVLFTFDGYLPAVAPSAPRGGSVSDPNQIGYTVSWTVPSETQLGQGNADGVTIVHYVITYSTPGDSTTRIGGAATDSITDANAITTPNATPQNLFNTLFPECIYTFIIKAANDVDTTLLSNPLTFTAPITPTLTPIAWNGVVTFPARYFGTVRKCAEDSVDITQLINNNSDWTSNSFRMVLNDSTRRGKLAAANATITTFTAILNGITTTAVFNTWKADASLNTPAITNSANINAAGTVTDYYGSTFAGWQGYFLASATTITINAAAFVASNSKQTVALTQDITATPSNNTILGAFDYYYDTLPPQVPRIKGVSIILNTTSADFMQISGVFVIHTLRLIATTSITAGDLGHFFYTNPMLNYTCAIGAATTAITPASETTPNVGSAILTTGYDATNFVFSPSVDVTFVRPTASAKLTSEYATTTAITVRANNVKGNADLTSNTIQAIVDGASVNLVTNVWAQSLPTTGLAITDAIYGLRVPCGDASSNFTLPLNYPTAIPYDNTQSIVTTQELQVAGGAIVTPAVNGYLNYSAFTHTNGVPNTFNYGDINRTGYRFITFAWNVNSIAQRNNFSFTLRSLISANGVNATTSSIKIGSSPLYIFYRLEQVLSPIPTGTTSSSSVWIDGANNANSNNIHIANDYFTPLSGPPMGGLTKTAKNGDDYTIEAWAPSVQPGVNVNLYIRVGLPMDIACSLRGVTPIFT